MKKETIQRVKFNPLNKEKQIINWEFLVFRRKKNLIKRDLNKITTFHNANSLRPFEPVVYVLHQGLKQ